MKSKYILAFFLAVPVVYFIASYAYYERQFYQSSETVVVRVRGFDPRDLLSGHYLYLQPDWENTNCCQFDSCDCPAGDFAREYKYFLQEDFAINLDRLVATEKVQTDMTFVYKKGSKPLVKDLLINGLPWKEGFKQYQESLESK